MTLTPEYVTWNEPRKGWWQIIFATYCKSFCSCVTEKVTKHFKDQKLNDLQHRWPLELTDLQMMKEMCGVQWGTERNRDYFTKITVHIYTWGACASKQNESQTVLADQEKRHRKKCYMHAGGKLTPDPCSGGPLVIKSIID